MYVRKEPVDSAAPFQPASTTTSSSTTTLSSSPAMMSGLSSASHDFAAPTALMGMPSTSQFVSPTIFAPFPDPIQFNSPSFAQCFHLRIRCPSLSQQQVLFMWSLFLETLVYAQGVIESTTNQLKHRMICALGMRSGMRLLSLIIHRFREDLAMLTTTHVMHVLGVDGHVCSQGISLLKAWYKASFKG